MLLIEVYDKFYCPTPSPLPLSFDCINGAPNRMAYYQLIMISCLTAVETYRAPLSFYSITGAGCVNYFDKYHLAITHLCDRKFY
jgi:hypothetical protein